MRRFALVLLLFASCSEPAPHEAAARVRLWHTFSPRETEALNAFLAEREPAVETTLLPFSRAQHIVRETLEQGKDCPDLVRIDATWLPGLAKRELLRPAPDDLAERPWLPETDELTRFGSTQYGLPQAIDGLALLYDPTRVAKHGANWPPHTLNELIAVAHRLTIDGEYGLSVRVDGYWFVAFLRALGGDVLDPGAGSVGVDAPIAAEALSRFADLFAADGVAPPPPPPGREAPTAARRWRDGEVAIVVDGPWAVAEMRGGNRELAVAPFPDDPTGRPAAPLGGAVFVVPTCAGDPDAAWQLADDLTDPDLQAAWSKQLGVIPTTKPGLERAGPFAQKFREALRKARPLPRHPVAAEMFDDLTPAVQAVVAGDATAEEALAGVTRAWTRLLAREGLR